MSPNVTRPFPPQPTSTDELLFWLFRIAELVARLEQDEADLIAARRKLKALRERQIARTEAA